MPYPRTKCFVIEPTGKYRLYLRRYTHGNGPCPKHGNYHQAFTLIEDNVSYEDPRFPEDAKYEGKVCIGDYWPHGDPRWPTHCDCGQSLDGPGEWQLFPKELYQRQDQPESTPITLDEAQPGALWRQPWLEDNEAYRGVDGHSWMCRTPGGDWMIDGPANNCTMKGDTKHKCWCRHGTAPEFHVDKSGITCAAGAGSIVAGNYHGFLHNGWLTEG